MSPEEGLWIFFRQAGLAVAGISGGLLVSGGVFTVLMSVGLVPRFAGKTHTGRNVFLYEEMVVFGTLLGNFLSVFGYPSSFFQRLYGLFAGRNGGGRGLRPSCLCFSACLPGFLWAVWLWRSRRCWIPFPSLPGAFPSATVSALPCFPWRWENWREVCIIFSGNFLPHKSGTVR